MKVKPETCCVRIEFDMNVFIGSQNGTYESLQVQRQSLNPNFIEYFDIIW